MIHMNHLPSTISRLPLPIYSNDMLWHFVFDQITVISQNQSILILCTWYRLILIWTNQLSDRSLYYHSPVTSFSLRLYTCIYNTCIVITVLLSYAVVWRTSRSASDIDNIRTITPYIIIEKKLKHKYPDWP